MDYEKAYKTVLETATKWIKDGCTDKEKICLESVFPELRESEDERNERIRKAILGLSYLDGIEPILTKCSVTRSDIRSYLEKQKESLHISETCKDNGDSFTDEDERIRKWLVDYFKAVEKCCIHWDISPERIVSYLEKQKEQKPVQLEEEKEYIRTLKSRIADFLRGKDKDEVDTTYYQRICDWLDGRHVEQKPAEWSKEDEDKLYRIMETLLADKAAARQENPRHYDVLCEAYDELIAWLKSLRPSWKPSKEQMDRLFSIETALREDYCNHMADFLANLYADLKKLGVKEEPEYHQHFDSDC